MPEKVGNNLRENPDWGIPPESGRKKNVKKE